MMDRHLIFFYIIGTSSVIAAFVIASQLLVRGNLKYPAWLVKLLCVFSSYMLLAQYLKYSAQNFYVDFSHWAVNLYNIITQGRPLNPGVDFLFPGRANYLSVHFVPLLYVLAAPFKLWPYNETIIILNFILMVSAAIPAYKLAYIHYKDKTFSLLVASLLLWYPTFQYIVLYEFDMLRFSIPVILWMLYFWEKKNTVMYLLFAVIAVLVREEVGLTVMMFGLYVFIFQKKHVLGIITSVLGAGAFVTITQIIMPAFRTSPEYAHIAAALFGAFGGTFSEVVVNVIKHPVLTLTTICSPLKLANVFMYFLPLSFVPLLSPSVLIVTLANLGVVLLSLSFTHSSYMLYYLSPSIPFIFYAFIKAWPRLLLLLQGLTPKRRLQTNGSVNCAAMGGILAAMLAANVFFGPSPISLQFWFKNLRPAPFRTQNFHYSVYKVTEHHRKVEEFCELIPDSAVVSAEQFLTPRLFKKQGIMVFPQLESVDGKIKADYVFIDKTNPVKTGIAVVPDSYSGLRDNPQIYYDSIEKNPQTWELVKSQDGYFVFKRRF